MNIQKLETIKILNSSDVSTLTNSKQKKSRNIFGSDENELKVNLFDDELYWMVINGEVRAEDALQIVLEHDRA